MTDHTQTGAPLANPHSPTPLAVPWTPPVQQAPAVTPQPVPAAPLPPQAVAPQPIAPQRIMPRPQHPTQPHPATPQVAFQPPHNPNPQAAQPVAYNPAPQYAPAPTQQPMPAYEQLHNRAAMPMNHAPQPLQQPGYAPQAMAQPPQMTQHDLPPMPAQGVTMAETQPVQKSKSLLANLLKRSPKPALQSVPTSTSEPMANMAAATPKVSGSLFDKNFVFGLAAGTVLGFLVLPMLFGNGPEKATLPNAPTAQLTAPQLGDDLELAQTPITITEGEAFIDAALTQDAP